MTNPANMTSPQVHQCKSSIQTLSYYLSLSMTLGIFTLYSSIPKTITKFFLTYPTSNSKTATSQPHLWKNTGKVLVSLTFLVILDLDFIFYYAIYYIASQSLAISRLKQSGKFKLLIFILTLKPYWLLVVTVYEMGEVLAEITLEHLQKLFEEKEKNATENEEERKETPPSTTNAGSIPTIIECASLLLDGIEYSIATGSDETHSGIQKAETDADNKKEMKISSDLNPSKSQSPSPQAKGRLYLNLVDFDTKEEEKAHLNKHTIADETISPSFSLSPFHFTTLRSKIPVSLPSSLRSRIREMIDSVTRDLKPVEKHKAVRIIVETEQYIEKLYSRSKSNMPRIIEQLDELERKLKDIFENAEMTATQIEDGDRNENEGQDKEDVKSGVLTPSTSSGEWTPVELPSTPSAHSKHTLEDDAEDKEENISSDTLTPSTSSTPSSPGLAPSIPSSPSSQSRPSSIPTTTITGRPWHLFLIDAIYKCDNSLHDEWRTTELFNAWCKKKI